MMSTESKQIGIQEFIRKAQVSIEDITRADPPSWHPWATADGTTHWHVTIERERARMGVPFHMGVAHVGPPTLADVLDAVAADAVRYELVGHLYSAWCGELGYEPYGDDEDDHRATFDATARQAAQLQSLLGEELYRTLLHRTRRER